MYGASSFFETMPSRPSLTNRSKHFVPMALGVFHVLDATVVSQKFSQCGFALPVRLMFE